MAEGWVKLHRNTIDWEWFKEPNTFHVFMYLLMDANHANGSHQGTEILRGQTKTGRKTISEKTGLTEMKVRTALKNLKKTKEITIQSHAKFSIITIVNWSTYQSDNQQDNQQVTSKQPASNQQVTTNKNDNNNKNDKKVSNDIPYQEIVDLWNSSFLDTDIPKVRGLTEPRKKAIKARFDTTFENNLSFVSQAFDKIRAGPHLMGDNDRGWTVSFDWAFKPANLVKILEGNYDAKFNNSSNNSQSGRGVVAARSQILSEIEGEQSGGFD